MNELIDQITAHTVIIRLFEWIELFLKYYVTQGYQALSDFVSVSLGIVLALYIVIRGYSVVTGIESLSISEFFKHLFKVSMMYFLAMNWGFFSSWIIMGVEAIVDGIAVAELSANPLQLPFAVDLKTALQSTFSQFYWLGSELWKQGGIWSNPSALLSGLMIWAEGSVLIGIGSAEILLAKIMLSILFTIAPIIGVLSIFKPFQGVLDVWIGLIVSFAFLEILITAVLIIALSLAYTVTGSSMMMDSISGLSGVGVGWPMLIIAVLCILMMTRANALSMALGRVSTGASASVGVSTLLGNLWRPASFIFKTSAKGAKQAPFLLGRTPSLRSNNQRV